MKRRQKSITSVVSEILNKYLDWVSLNYDELDTKDVQGVFDVVYLTYLDKPIPEYSSAIKAIAARYADEFNNIMSKYSVDKPDLLYEICMLYLTKAIKKGVI